MTTPHPTAQAAETLTKKLRTAPATTDEYDLHARLNVLLDAVGLNETDCGGTIDFVGVDPVLPDPLRLVGGAAISLVAKSVAIAKIWQMRGGSGQDIAIDLRVASYRLCPFYDHKWELLNGHAIKDAAQVDPAFSIPKFYQTADTAHGRYRGITEQVRMSQTPGYYTYPLSPRGSSWPEWR